MIALACEICGTPFQVKPYRAKTARFCSRRCGGTWHLRHRKIHLLAPDLRGNTLRVGMGGNGGSFKPGHKTWNRGLKGIHLSPGSEFKKGRTNDRAVPVGTVRERRDKNGSMRAWVKMGERRWVLRAVQIYESIHGPVPRGCLVHHEDRNTMNDDISNLRLLTRSAHINEHRQELLAAKAVSA